MRIVAGILKGRIFNEPRGHRTHPMSEKMRGALFNALGDIDGLTVLDAFSGSGALSFEAISRGAKSAVAVEKDTAAHKAIEANIKDLKLGKQIQSSRANIGGWSIHNMERKFDIVLFDPPYDDIQPNSLQKLIDRHTKKDGLVVLSYPGRAVLPEFEKVNIVLNKDYGDSRLVFYRKI